MRRAQRRLHQFTTVVAVAVFVAAAALASLHGSQSAGGAGVRSDALTPAHMTVGQHNELGGIRWRRTV